MSRSYIYFLSVLFSSLLVLGCSTDSPKEEETVLSMDSLDHTTEIEPLNTTYFENGKCTYRPTKPIPSILEKLPQLIQKDFYTNFPKLVKSLGSLSKAYQASNYSSDGLYTKTYPALYKSEETMLIDFGLMEPYTLVLLTDQYDATKNLLPYETMNHEHGTIQIRCAQDTCLIFYSHENELIVTYLASNSNARIETLENNYFDGTYLYETNSTSQNIVIRKSTIVSEDFPYSSITHATDMVTGIPLKSENPSVSDIVSLQDGEQTYWFDLIRKDFTFEFYRKRKIEEDGLEVTETLVQDGLVFRLKKQL